jgi:uncharacterized protein (TIGR04255 family)
MAQTNENIVEVLFAMWFDPNANDWDSTYFGRFHERIIPLGFTQKQEQKEVEIKVGPHHIVPEVSDGKLKMTFKNPDSKTAVIISDHFISFHKLAPYKDWEQLLNDVVDPCFKIYKELGLGNSLKEVQWLYLNKYQISQQQKISSVVKFWPTIDDGVETNVSFRTRYNLPDGESVQLQLNGNVNPEGLRDLFFECSTFVKAIENSDYRSLAIKAHDAVNKIYDKLM